VQKNTLIFEEESLHNKAHILNSLAICFAKYNIYSSEHFIHILCLVPLFAEFICSLLHHYSDIFKFKIKWKSQLEPFSFTQIPIKMWNHKFIKLIMQN